MEKICYHGRQGKEWKELRGLFPRSSFFQDRFDILEQRETAMNRKRLTKRILALSLTAALTLPVWAQASYQDTAGHWAETAIEKWSGEYQILNGYEDGTFRPDDTITRGAFAGILSRFLKYTKQSGAGTFSDTAGNYWESDILKLNAAGVYLGDHGEALVFHDISRQQAITMVARAFGLTETSGELPYADGASVQSYARGYLLTMYRAGYITDVGLDRCFRPESPITRVEVVNLLNSMVDKLIAGTGTYSENVDGTVLITAVDGAELKGMTVSGDLIVAPGVTGTVTLRDCKVQGSVRNLGSGSVKTVTDTPEKPDTPDDPNDADYPWIEPDRTIVSGNTTIPVYNGLERNILSADDFYWDERGRLVCTNENFRTRFGIDVSAYQNRRCPDNTIDWQAVADDGVEFAMIRVGLRGYGGGNIMADAFAAQNIDGAMDAGIETGVYFFSQAITVEEAVEEADYVLGVLREHEIRGPVTYDWELGNKSYRANSLEPKIATACALAFCQRIEAAGYQPVIYMGKEVGYNRYNLPQLEDYPIWFPEYRYPGTAQERVYPSFYYQMDYWQYCDGNTRYTTAEVNGITGPVDMNLQFIRG